MSEDDYSPIELEKTSRPFVKASKADRANRRARINYKTYKTYDEEETPVKNKPQMLGRFTSFESALRPNFGRFRNSFRKLNCFKNTEDEAIPMMEVSRHKSIDIGVGLARRVSLFLFTRRTVCVHPYHPYTPEQTTRKLCFCFEDKYLERHLSKP